MYTKESKLNAISVKNLSKKYEKTVFKNISFEIKKESIFIITGESGSGKTTLLNIIAGLDRENVQGEVCYGVLNGKNILKLNDTKLAALRKDYVGFIFQFHELIPEFNVLENVTMPLLINNFSKSRAEKIAKKILKEMRLEKDIFFKKPGVISGGQQQRVSIARAMIKSEISKDLIIFADEPTGNLDPVTKHKVLHDLIKLVTVNKITLVMVTHEENPVGLIRKFNKEIRIDRFHLIKPEDDE